MSLKTKKLKKNNNKQTSNKSLPLNPVTHFDIIARFCEENADSIIMPKSDIGSHNINKHNL